MSNHDELRDDVAHLELIERHRARHHAAIAKKRGLEAGKVGASVQFESVPEGKCIACGAVAREGVIEFVTMRMGERVHLQGALCDYCGGKMEKHLKRMLPKKRFLFTPTGELEPPFTSKLSILKGHS